MSALGKLPGADHPNYTRPAAPSRVYMHRFGLQETFRFHNHS